MAINFLIKALNMDIFYEYMLKDDEELSFSHASWLTVDATPGYPCRVSLTDAKIGENVLVVSFCHHNVSSPYRAYGAIFVREKATMAVLDINEVPEMLRCRILSIRAYNAETFMIGAEVISGEKLEFAIDRQFQNRDVEYIHIHNANPGCFNCSVYRA
ncbi:DUF1203 domain-containing protein [uncultured Shewanella sp.]|uniref:DUF1203 domain-containing protein n=1 Tax=uncultured Shewanella sp. TaxID=173975 RepID=UPI002622BFF0|nr:DUF1203 domain-containing protein [uncultured Shewanella sp.]